MDLSHRLQQMVCLQFLRYTQVQPCGIISKLLPVNCTVVWMYPSTMYSSDSQWKALWSTPTCSATNLYRSVFSSQVYPSKDLYCNLGLLIEYDERANAITQSILLGESSYLLASTNNSSNIISSASFCKVLRGQQAVTGSVTFNVSIPITPFSMFIRSRFFQFEATGSCIRLAYLVKLLNTLENTGFSFRILSLMGQQLKIE